MGKKSSWGWIVFWLIFFWPIGLVMALNKMEYDKSSFVSGKSKILSLVGKVLIFIGLCGLISFSSTFLFEDFVLTVIFLSGGIVLVRKAKKMKLKSEKVIQYINYIVNQKVKNIDYIAQGLGLEYNEVLKDLEKMIDTGYLENYYIHIGNREILSTLEQIKVEVKNDENIKTTVVVCDGCGANNILPEGKISKCEYCSTPLKA